jgi:hypothetical protein
MQNSEQEYPLHQPTSGPQAGDDSIRPASDDRRLSPTMPLAPDGAAALAPKRPRRKQAAGKAAGSTTASILPRGRLKNAVITGIIAGFLCIAQSIIITFVNASTYRAFDTAAKAAKHATGSTLAQLQATENALALATLGIGALTFAISLIILLVAGFILGKIVVDRRLAFLAGFIAGILDYGLGFITRYIPNYPGNQTVASSGVSNVIVTSIFLVVILFLVWGVIGGLITLLGAWIASRRHPYYVG